MTRQVDITFHLEASDQEPGSPQDMDSLREWLVPDLARAVRRVIGHEGDYGAWYVGHHENITVAFVDDDGLACCGCPEFKHIVTISGAMCLDCDAEDQRELWRWHHRPWWRRFGSPPAAYAFHPVEQ